MLPQRVKDYIITHYAPDRAERLLSAFELYGNELINTTKERHSEQEVERNGEAMGHSQ